MERFLQLYQPYLMGVLEGFDRLLFRGTLRSICFGGGLEKFLVHHGVKLKDFGRFADRLTQKIKCHAKKLAERLGRPYVHVPSAKADKDAIVRRLLADNPIREGLIAVLYCVEPCYSFDVGTNPENGWLALRSRPRQCTHLYFYYLDRDFGLMHVRLQTWLPFPIQICLNGREYLARQLTKEGIGFEQRDNSFSRIDHLPRAQELLDRLQTRSWIGLLNRWARRVMPLLAPRSWPRLRPYYWTLRQGEYATDLLFQNEAALQAVYPQLLDHALRHFSCRDVLRFLGRRTNRCFNGEVTTDRNDRPEGVRIKHRVEENSIKMYDKQGCILRIETTINQPSRFRVRRLVTRNGRRRRQWVAMRKGVADLPRRAQISKAANRRYLEALAGVSVPLPTPAHRVLDPVSRPIVRAGRPYRGLRPLTAADAKVFQVILDGRFAVQGFRNRDLCRALIDRCPQDAVERRHWSAKCTRWLRLLRAHGLIRKVSTTRYYRITPKGVHVMTTAQKLREIDLQRLAA
jgi:hypothetical protein